MTLESPVHLGKRRLESWWEPTFNPPLHGKLSPSDWDFSKNSGPTSAFLSASSLEQTVACRNGEIFKAVQITFKSCDFQGSFNHNPSMLFDKCVFIDCDFGLSTWKRVTFRNCTFQKCSISQTTFHDCEFRGCKWESIGISGSKTFIYNTVIHNPRALLYAGFSGTDPKKRHDKEHISTQKYRLEGTKAHLARSILISHQNVGDDDTFYMTARLHDLQQAKARVSAGWHWLWFQPKHALHSRDNPTRAKGAFSCAYWSSELTFLHLVGAINGWGSRLIQPLLLLIATSFIFGLVYNFALPDSSHGPWQKTFDIASIAGYTNASQSGQSTTMKIVECGQLIISLFLYTIFFATAVSRFSRSR